MCYSAAMAAPRTFTISIPPDLAKRVDKLAKDEGRSRSEFFREAARQYIERRQRWDKIFALGNEIGAASGIDEAVVMKIVKASRRASRRK